MADSEAINIDDSLNENESLKDSKKIGSYDSMESFTKDGLSTIVEATKCINSFPSGTSRDLYCAYPTFGKIVDSTSDRILNLISGVLKQQNIRGNIQRRQIDEQFELLTECNDIMLERINLNLDELVGIRRTPLNNNMNTTIASLAEDIRSPIGIGSWNTSAKKLPEQNKSFLYSKNISKSQLSFKTPINNSNTPFVPIIKEKSNSLKPLAILPEYNQNGDIESYLHPYEFELTKFFPSQLQLKIIEPKLPKKIENTPYDFIENLEQLQNLVKELSTCNEIAVDIEHHSYRSFQGFSCLIQLSTRFKDYIIDAIKLRDELHILNEIFTNSKILKIFHGADLDIQWLQRDFALYVVNMFDSHQAAKILHMPKLSLAYLLKHFCDIDADKTFQLADWRIRPLPQELIHYARQDTHYLIYIYELLNNELIAQGNEQKNLLKQVYERSIDICKKRYIKPTFNGDLHKDLYRKSKKIFDNRQLYALKKLFQWRDKTARKEDESYGYVLPNHMLLQISESLPREMQGILACCNPIPPLVRQNLHLLHQIILKAKDQPLIKPIINEEIVNRANISVNEVDYKIYDFHDNSHNLEFRDDLPTLFNLNLSEKTDLQAQNNIDKDKLILSKPIMDIFEKDLATETENVKEKLDKIRKRKFITPYQRYKAVIPFVERQRLEEIAKEEAIKKSKQLCPIPVNTNEVKKESHIDSDDKDGECQLLVKKDLKRKLQNDNKGKLSLKSKKQPEVINTANKINDPSSSSKKFENTKNKNSIKELIKSDTIKSKANNKNQNDVVEILSSNDEEEKTTKSYDKEKPRSATNMKRSTKPGKSNNKPLKKLKTGQSSDKTIDLTQIDLTQIDFNKFKGGMKNSQSSTEYISKFQGKSKTFANTNKKFNKMFSFVSTNKKK